MPGQYLSMAPLKRHIGQISLFLLVLNAIMGTGVFFLPAVGMGIAGSWSIVSWIVMSLLALGMAWIFAELISMEPDAGGIYRIVKAAFGEHYGFLFGWISWIAANLTIAMLIVGSFNYFLPSLSTLHVVVFSIGSLLIFNYVNYRGICISTKMLVVFGALTLLALLMLIVPGVPAAAQALPQFSFGSFSFPLVFLAI